MNGWWILPSVVLGTALWIAFFVWIFGAPPDTPPRSHDQSLGACHA